jgi:hypothetical protein
MTSQALRSAARVNGGAFVVLVFLLALLHTRILLPNEYGVPDGMMLFFIGLGVVLFVSVLLVAIGAWGLKQAADPTAQRRAILVAGLPLLIPLAIAAIGYIFG